jgi:glycosyltransferase involved in cell wall biosynthesis
VTESPLLSIVVPWRDFPDSVSLASRIVKPARQEGLQVVVVDDASHWSDDCDVSTFIEAQGAQYERLEKVGGPGAARNAGLAKAQGRFVGFSDADDVVHAKVLLTMAQVADAAGADVVIGAYRHVAPQGDIRLHMPGKSFEAALNDQPAIWRYVFRREFLESHQICFSPQFYAEDLVFLLRVLAGSPRTIVHSEICYDYMASASPTQLSSRVLSEHEFRAVLREIESIEGPNCNSGFERIRNAWLARIWLRRVRSAQGNPAKFMLAQEFPLRPRIVLDSAVVGIAQMRMRLLQRRRTTT